MSDMNIAPFLESQAKRCALRTPYAKISGSASAVDTNGFAAGIPYLPPRPFLPSGSMRKILPNAEPRFCASPIGSPPLPPSAMPTYRSPKSAVPGRAVGLNAIAPPL